MAETALAEKKSFSLALTEKLDSVTDALPNGFNKARFVQNALSLLNDNPSIAQYGQAQIIGGLMKGAYLGLDFYSKECYLIPYGKTLNYQTDYRGEKNLRKNIAFVQLGTFMRRLSEKVICSQLASKITRKS